MYGADYDYLIEATIQAMQKYIWNVVRESFAAHHSVLRMERELNAQFDQDKKYAFEQRGNTTIRTYSEAYTKAYDKMLDGMVEKTYARIHYFGRKFLVHGMARCR